MDDLKSTNYGNDNVDISINALFNNFTVKAIEAIYEKFGGLQKGSFCISRETFSNNADRILFRYPAGMNAESALEFNSNLLDKLKHVTLENLNRSMSN